MPLQEIILASDNIIFNMIEYVIYEKIWKALGLDEGEKFLKKYLRLQGDYVGE